VTGPRSRRARAGKTARSRKGSIPAEGTSILPAALPFARRRSRRDLGRSEAVRGDSKPREQSRRRPGCPRRHEKGACEYRSRITPRLLSNVSARELLRQVMARRPSVSEKLTDKANATGIGWCRRAAERKLHSRARAFGSSGCARASYSGCRSRQASPKLREARTRWQRNAWTGAKAGPRPKGHAPVAKASITCLAVAKPRGRQRPEPGARKGVAGQRFLPYGRHLGPFSHTRRFTRSSGGPALAALGHGTRRASDTGPVWEPRHGCQKRVRTRRERKTTPPAMNDKPIGAVRRSESYLA